MTDVSAIVLELADELRNGGSLENLVAEFAADYGVRADVLRARFDRAYPNGVPARVDMAAKVEEAVTNACRRYGVPRDATLTGPNSRGEVCTLICRVGRGVRMIAVDHATARVWEMDGRSFNGAAARGAIR